MISDTNPRDFFEEFVKPAFIEWSKARTEVRRSMILVTEANNMAERMLAYWAAHDPSKVFGITDSPKAYRQRLARHECPDFALVWDLADGHKHVHLNRSPRQITSAYQVSRKSSGGPLGAAPLGRHPLGGMSVWLEVELDDGNQRKLSPILENVVAMWERLLLRDGL